MSRRSIARVAAIALRQVYLIRGSVSRVLPLFVWVAVDIVLWGFLTRYLNAVSGASVNFVPLFLGAVLLWDFFARVMHGVTMAFLEDVWSRNFLNVFSTPLSIGEYLSGLVLSSMGTSAIGLVVMLLLATALFGLSLFGYGVMLIPFLLVLVLFGIALGIVGCSVVLRFGPAAEWFVWPIPALVAPFAGVFYPVATLPAWMRVIAFALPPSHIFEAMRAIVMGQPPAADAVFWGVGLGAVYVVAACWIFARVYRHAVRTGLIARYSAESVS